MSMDKVEQVKKNQLKIDSFRKKMLKWFEANGRVFPWRSNDLDDYSLVMVECLLQRTLAKKVENVWHDFFEEFKNWEDLRSASISEIENSIKSLGLSKQKAPRILALAESIRQNGDVVPNSYKDLIALPMVGQYIANSILSIIYDRRAPMLDVNMARVLERYYGERVLSDIRHDPHLQEISRSYVNSKNHKNLNWAILDFGAIVCTARNPKCYKCIYRKTCKFKLSQD
jgi:A/G-specific adenine glycosylase